MYAVTVTAPAKINPHLRVRGLRPDGFHHLESIFAALDFGDTLRFEPRAGDGALEIRMEGPVLGEADLSGEKNIVFRAVSLFRRRTGFSRSLGISVEKRIPLGGGLGGGSSDAAAALLALNALAAAGGAAPLDAESLAELAAVLGSDVPFFLGESAAAWVTGRGERVRPLAPPPNLPVVLVNPGFPSATARAFRLLDEFRAAAGPESPENRTPDPPESALIRAFAGPPRDWPFGNDFLPVLAGGADPDGGAYRSILARLRDSGAEFAGLSGAGSTCFGVFAEPDQARKAARFLSKFWNMVKVTFILAHKALPVVE